MTNVLAYFLSPILEEKITSSNMVSVAENDKKQKGPALRRIPFTFGCGGQI
tara:strand:+ start:343 stop:495 length:153 start_codon:yes stop_codon:yes gene_type:complete